VLQCANVFSYLTRPVECRIKEIKPPVGQQYGFHFFRVPRPTRINNHETAQVSSYDTHEERNESLLDVGLDGFFEGVSTLCCLVVGGDLVTAHCSQQAGTFHCPMSLQQDHIKLQQVALPLEAARPFLALTTSPSLKPVVPSATIYV